MMMIMMMMTMIKMTPLKNTNPSSQLAFLVEAQI